MSILHSKDFLAGLISIGIGGFLVHRALDYGVGSPQAMGSGFFPFSLGVLLLLIGVVLAISGIRTLEPIEPIPVRPFIVIPLSILAFALLLGPVGFAPAGAATVVLAGLADRRVGLPVLAALAVVVVPSVWLLFVEGFGVTMPFVTWNP